MDVNLGLVQQPGNQGSSGLHGQRGSQRHWAKVGEQDGCPLTLKAKWLQLPGLFLPSHAVPWTTEHGGLSFSPSPCRAKS